MVSWQAIPPRWHFYFLSCHLPIFCCLPELHTNHLNFSPVTFVCSFRKTQRHFHPAEGNTIICTLQGIHETLLLWSMRTQPDPWHRTTAQTWTLLWGRHRNKHFIVFMWEWSDRLLCSMQLVTRQSRNWTCNFLIKGWASAPKRWKNSHCWNLKTAKHFLIYYR